MSIPKSIAIGLVKAQAYARGVAKEGKNTQGAGYRYATSEDIIAEGRKSLLEGGKIAFAVTGWTFAPLTDTGPARTKTGNDGKVKTLATASGRIVVKYLLVALDDGETYEAETSAAVVPEFGRPDDKAEYGALTQCHAYTLRGLLNLPRGVDGEVDMNQRDDERGGPEETPPAERRPADSAPRASGPANVSHRSAGDHAAAVQTGVDQSHGRPVFDPAHVALCNEFVKRAKEWQSDPQPLYEEVIAAKLPDDLTRTALLEVFVAAFELAPSDESLKYWSQLAKACKGWGPEKSAVLKSALTAADRRLADAADRAEDQAA